METDKTKFNNQIKNKQVQSNFNRTSATRLVRAASNATYSQTSKNLNRTTRNNYKRSIDNSNDAKLNQDFSDKVNSNKLNPKKVDLDNPDFSKISSNDVHLKQVNSIKINSNKIDLNESLSYLTFEEKLSNFQNLIRETEKVLSKSSLKRSDSINSFEAKFGLSRGSNSRILRRKSVNVRYSKSRLEQIQQEKGQLKSTNKENSGNKLNRVPSNRQTADSDDEKSKKKVLNSSIIEKRNKLNNKLDLGNANEHFTNLLRVRNENKLIKLVRMHLLMLLDLDGENFSNVFEEEDQNSKKTNTIKKKKHDSKLQDKGLFQQVLTEEGICRLYLLTDFIGRPRNINQEGIFRKCGSNARQQELKYRLQNNISLELETGKYTVHDCTNVLKTCLSEMPEPLLTDLFFKIITQKLISKDTNSQNKNFTELDFEIIFGDKNLKIIQLILLLIPLKKRKFAYDLLTLLNKISSKENSTNRMNAKSLATLFAPHLLCPKSMSPTDLQRYCSILTIQLEFMIKNVKEIFKTPIELTMDIRKELERMDNLNANEEDDEGINTVVTFCDRREAAITNQTEKHIAELYAHIQSMPETPAKKKLIKQFNRQNGGLTPQLDKENSKKKQNKLKSIGDKLKNAKNLFKGQNSAVKSGNYASSFKKEEDNLYASQNRLDNFKNDYSKKGAKINELNDNFNKMPHILSPTKKHEETPLADLTHTKFGIDELCLEDEDTTELMFYHKKLSECSDSNDEIFYDYFYTSESILL